MKYTFEIDEIHQINKIKVNLLLEHTGYTFKVWLLGYGNIGSGFNREDALKAAKEYIKKQGLTKKIVAETQKKYIKVSDNVYVESK
jgi:hypothetical protein